MQNTKLFSVRQATEFLGVHIETLRRWDREGKLTSIRIGKSNHRRYDPTVLEKFKSGENTPNHPVSIYADRIIDFHSPAITDEKYFTRLVLAIAQKVESLVDCELVDGPYDKKRDILGYEIAKYNKRNPVYIQCKHVRDISETILKNEVSGLYQHVLNKTILKPSKIIFALSTNVNATVRDNIRLYVEQLLGVPRSKVVFWCPVELDAKIKGEQSILKQFILTGSVDANQATNFKTPDIKQEYADNIKRTLARSQQLIQSRQFPEAEEHLLLLLGKIPDEEKFAKDRAKTFNNLGLCYKWDGNHDDNYQKALDAFNKALDLDPTLHKAQCNLINTLLLTKNEENDNKAWDLVNKLWKEIGPEDEFVVITYIQTFSIKFGKQKGLEEAEKIRSEVAKKGKPELTENAGFWSLLASTYFFTDQLDKSQEIITKILEQNEFDVDAVYLQAMVKMRNAKQDSKPLDDFLENYKNSQEIRNVESLLRKAYQLAREQKRYDLLPEIYHNWDVCRLWLWKTSGEKLENLEYPLAENTKIDTHKISKIPERLLSKDYEGAYTAYKEISKDNDVPTNEKINIAWIFREYGYPEISLRILDEIDPALQLPYKYWLFKSICQVLTENKAQAIESCNQAKKAAKEKGEGLQEVLSHNGALLMRYQKEGDRLLQNAIEYDNEFPAQKMLTKLDINNEKDKAFIRDSMIQRQQWFEGVLETYLNNPLPVYTLEKTFKRPFVEIWEGRGANFPWEFHTPSDDYQKHLIELLESSDEMILDYMSLLTLIKANLFGFVERTGKKMYVHKLTFDKIQQELVQYESKTLRKLWDFLRKSSLVQIIAPNEELDENLKKLTKVFEPWLLQTIQVAKNKGYLLVTDDLRLSRAVTNEGVKVINSFTFLIYAQNKKWIEKKDYSQILGEIADCVYSFIPFNYEDLHEIIWQDDYKLTRRSFHLIHQLFLPGSGLLSFINVFVDFTKQLWQSGALSEDKIFWTKFITEEINILFEKWENEKTPATDEGREFVNKFALMWGMAVQMANVEDLKALRSELDSIPGDSLLFKIKESIIKHIQLRLEQIDQTPKKGEALQP
ncbi:MerR family DNA-binding transcriptional regulator [Candidatus Curtissbacteria bacterium]|nr:MerR family DNA-binding transcriptional regulator [Candidatus Curtissbacteria bacterium]